MRYLLPPAVAVRYLPALRRPLAPRTTPSRSRSCSTSCATSGRHIVHTHMAKAGTLGRAGRGDLQPHGRPRARPRASCTPITATCSRGISAPRRRALFLGVERLLARVDRSHRRHLAAHSRRAARASTASADADQYRVVPLGFDLGGARGASTTRARAAARARAADSGRRAVVTTVGRLTAIKQHGCFSKSARLVGRAHPAARVPDRRRRRAARRARSRGRARSASPTRVRFLGWRRDLATIYGATDVFLLTSRNEGTPVALIESLAAGVPGVSTDVGGVARRHRRATRSACSRRTATPPRSPRTSTTLLADAGRGAGDGRRGPRARARALRPRSSRRRHRRAVPRAAADTLRIHRDDRLAASLLRSSASSPSLHGLFFIWYQRPDWDDAVDRPGRIPAARRRCSRPPASSRGTPTRRRSCPK